MLKVDEIQKPIIGGSWTTNTDFGRLEIKIVPFWTGECTRRMACRRRLRYYSSISCLCRLTVFCLSVSLLACSAWKPPRSGGGASAWLVHSYRRSHPQQQCGICLLVHLLFLRRRRGTVA